MRLSCVTLAACAGALALGAAFAPAKAASGCCPRPEAPGSKVFDESEVSDEGGPGTPDPAPPDAAPQPTPLDHEAEGLVVGDAYEDVFRVLKEDNLCSRFFGGPRVAVTVFNEFARRLQRRTLGAGNVGLEMSGDYTSYRDGRSGASYRLFPSTTINSDGPFVVVSPPSGARLLIGSFPASSRPGKALMLLHELGHLIRGPDGWLLPNDGGDLSLSDRNTRTVESHCTRELLALRE